MGNVIAVVNHKGGTGKTTTTLNLAAGLVRYGSLASSCLVIDMDPHGCATSVLLGKRDGEPPARSVFDVLRRAITPQDGITSTVFDENIDIIPSSPALESVARTQLTDRLVKVTQSLSTAYGWILIDTPPNLGILTQNALMAADYVLIPTPCDGLSVGPLHMLQEMIAHFQERPNIWLQVLGVLVTMKDGRTALPKDILKEIKKLFPSALFKTAITANIKVQEAPTHFKSIYSYDSGCLGAAMYRDWIKKEFLRRHKALEKKRGERLEAMQRAALEEGS